MKILKPQKPGVKELRHIENLIEEICENEELSNIMLQDYKTENVKINEIQIEKAIKLKFYFLR